VNLNPKIKIYRRQREDIRERREKRAVVGTASPTSFTGTLAPNKNKTRLPEQQVLPLPPGSAR